MDLLALFCGLLFGLGVLLSGMSDPARVLGFLDLAGPWNPSLLVVLACAVLTAFVPLQLAQRRRLALLGEAVTFPQTRPINRRLLFGSALFGIGWGLTGLCPGPALAALPSLHAPVWLFVASLLAGMASVELWQRRTAQNRLADVHTP